MEIRKLPEWVQDENDLELYHHGIKGQRWGVRRFQNEDGTLTPAGMRRYNRLARKDAKEFARAKMFYGEGAGNRRKLIKAQVEQRSKESDYYKKAFEKALNEQDMAKHAEKATKERHRKDTANATKKTARSIKNLAMGTGASVTLTSLALYGGYKWVKNNPQVIKSLKENLKDKYDYVLKGRVYINKWKNH